MLKITEHIRSINTTICLSELEIANGSSTESSFAHSLTSLTKHVAARSKYEFITVYKALPLNVIVGEPDAENCPRP